MATIPRSSHITGSLYLSDSGILRSHKSFLTLLLIPKTKIKVVKLAPMGDPMQIFLRGYELTLRKDDASVIEVLPCEGDL